MSKRKRDPAFKQTEKMLLVELVKKHYNTIESKKTDAVSIREKNDEWRKISIEFNATSGLHTRDWTVIKNCWENLKKKAKSLIAQENRTFSATGGSPPKSFPVNLIFEKVTILIKPVSGFTNEFGKDGTLMLTNESQESPGKQIKLEHSPIDNSKDLSNYSPAMLWTPKTNILKTESEQKTCPRQPEHQQLSNSSSNSENIEPILQPSCSNVQSSYEATAPVRIKTLPESRRKPVLNQSQTLTQQRVDSLLSASQQAKEKHEVQMRILKVQEEREIELLKQERLRTEQEQLRILIMKEELKKLS